MEHNIMESTREVVASLEGQRIRVDEGTCSLDFYNFDRDHWELRDSAPWPLDRATASTWLDGWNRVDRFAAFNLLVQPQPY
jgi:hypothetical protein